MPLPACPIRIRQRHITYLMLSEVGFAMLNRTGIASETTHECC